jgi:hypothetical protein
VRGWVTSNRPIDIVTTAARQRRAPPFTRARFDSADGRTVPVDIVNNGHTIQWTPSAPACS